MKLRTRRPGKKTPAGQLAARNDEIRALHKDLDRADKSFAAVRGEALMWRDQTMRARADFLRTERMRQKTVDENADLKHQLRVLQDKLDGLQDKKPEDHPTIATEIPGAPKPIGPVVHVPVALHESPLAAVEPTAWPRVSLMKVKQIGHIPIPARDVEPQHDTADADATQAMATLRDQLTDKLRRRPALPAAGADATQALPQPSDPDTQPGADTDTEQLPKISEGATAS